MATVPPRAPARTRPRCAPRQVSRRYRRGTPAPRGRSWRAAGQACGHGMTPEVTREAVPAGRIIALVQVKQRHRPRHPHVPAVREELQCAHALITDHHLAHLLEPLAQLPRRELEAARHEQPATAARSHRPEVLPRHPRLARRNRHDEVRLDGAQLDRGAAFRVPHRRERSRATREHREGVPQRLPLIHQRAVPARPAGAAPRQLE